MISRQFQLKFVASVAVLALDFGINSRPATAGELGIGAEIAQKPGLSVQYAPAPSEAYHAVFHMGNDAAALSLDYQRFHYPSYLASRSFSLGLYGGFGLAGEAVRQTAQANIGESGEAWSLRFPAGVQASFSDLHLSAFAEAALTVGQLPKTTVGGAAAGGVRAYF